MLQAGLRVVGGKHDGELIPLTREKFIIGREEDCHLRPNSDLVSRHHCAFSIDDFSVRLRDLGSTNGTLVNNERLRGETQLSSGDRVTVGNLCLELLIGDSVESTASAGIQEESSSSTPILQGETSEISAEETSFEIPVPAQPAPEEQPAEPVAVTPEIAMDSVPDPTPAFDAPAEPAAMDEPVAMAAGAMSPPADEKPKRGGWWQRITN